MTVFKVGDKVTVLANDIGWKVGDTGVVTSTSHYVQVRFPERTFDESFLPRELELLAQLAEWEVALLKYESKVVGDFSGAKTEDVVNSPSHYTQYPVEVIELTRHMSFNRGNAVKYVARAGFKDKSKEVEDLKKARWYLDDEIAQLEKEEAK